MQLQKLTKAVITTALLLGISAQAWAHTALSRSNPAEGTSLEAAPKTIEMSFTEDVKLLRVVLTQEENAIDIDALLEEVESAMKAYEFCKERINTVQTKLDELLKDAPGSDASSTDAAEKKQQSSNGDDIPF